MDIPGAEEIAERLKKMLPPQLQDNGQSDPNIPPQVQQQLAELMQQHQQLTQALTSAQDDLERKTSEKAMELESKERIAFAGVNIDQQKIQLEYARLQNALVVADITAKAASAQAEMDREMEAISQMSEQAHEAALSAVEHQQGMEAQQQGAQNASQQSAQDASQQQPQVQPTEQSSAQ
jgi:ABC-type phosphate transport system auxiliary subunit